MVVALVVIVGGGLVILGRLRLLELALAFWLTFAAGIAVLAVIGHAMTARWHVGPITDGYFWWVLVTSPEILVFLFFMITDPKTIPATPRMRIVYAVSIGLLAVHPDRARAHRVLEQGRAARRADDRLRRPAAAEALLAAADRSRAPGSPSSPPACSLCTGPRSSPPGSRPQLRDRRTAHVHRPAAADRDRHVEGRPEQAPRENRARDRRRPGRRSRAPGSARSRTGTPRHLHARPLSTRLPELQRQLRAARGHPIVVPAYRLDRMGVHYEAGRRPGRGDRRGDPRRHTSADDVLRGPRDRPAPCGADRLPRDARAPERRRPLAGRARPASARHERPLACRCPRGRRGLRRRPPHRCRAEGRPELPPGRFPLRSHRGPAGDDGRRRSAGSTTTTTAGSTCSSSTPTARATSAATARACRGASSSGTTTGASRRSTQAAAHARRGLRRGRPERRRPHRPLRHERTERPAALERRRRHVHRGRPHRRDRLLRLALRRRRRRRERRRAARPVRLRLHGAAGRDPGVARRLPDEPPRRPRRALPEPREQAASARSAGRSGSTRSRTTTRSARSSPTRTATAGPTSTSRTTRTRTACT